MTILKTILGLAVVLTFVLGHDLKAANAPMLQPGLTNVPEPPKLTIEEIILAYTKDKIMLAIAKCESSFNPLAKNPSSSAKGVFQIIDSTWESFSCTGDALNAEDNIKCAAKIYKDGLHHWDKSRFCWASDK